MELASRATILTPSLTLSIDSKAKAMKAEGIDVCGFGAGEPDFDTPEHIKAAAQAALETGFTKYTPSSGMPELREAIAQKFAADNGLTYKPSQIIVSNGAKQSCYNACLALLDSGDEVIIPAPYWVSYPDMVELADATPVIVASTAERGFRIGADELAAAITPRTRLLILNSPCNPTGAAYSRADWLALGSVLRAHPEIVILSDEIYEHIYWGNEPFASFAQACPDLYDRTITVNGVSKAYAMTGWRLGYAAGPVDVIKAMTTIQSQSTTNACTISQAAARAALTGEQTTVREMCAEFRRRHDVVLAGLNKIPGFRCTPAAGTFYLFPNVEAAMQIKHAATDVELCERLLDGAGIALVPGTAFGAPGHVRLSFAASLETLGEALARLEKFMAT